MKAMHWPVWSEILRSGHEAMDLCHRDMMVSLGRIRDAIAGDEHAGAERIIGEFYDLCAIHVQIEDDCFAGRDHAFPHEALDDLVLKLRSAVRNRLNGTTALDMVAALERALLSDISLDKADLAHEWQAWGSMA